MLEAHASSGDLLVEDPLNDMQSKVRAAVAILQKGLLERETEVYLRFCDVTRVISASCTMVVSNIRLARTRQLVLHSCVSGFARGPPSTGL